jgi:hypothetical protein
MRFVLYFLVILFIGCSDSYDKHLSNTTDIEKVKDAVTGSTDVADEHNVSLSETTQKQLVDLNNTLNDIANEAKNEDKNPIITTETINQTFDAIALVKEDIIHSENISEDEKQEAISQIEDIERAKLKEGLEAYTESIATTDTQQVDEDQCNQSVENTGALPPPLPADKCFK